MDKFFKPDVTYSNAVKNKDIGVLRALLTGIIGSDPTFETTEFDEALRYIDGQSIELNGEKLEITEEYKMQEDETDESEWNEKYFQMNLVWLRDNFNLYHRLPKIKEIGKLVYKNKSTLGKVKVESRRKSTVEANTTNARGHVSKKEQTIRATGDGHSKDSRLIYKIWKWIKEHKIGVTIGVAFIFVLIALVIKFAAKN